MPVRVLSSTLAGVDAVPVEVETDISQGLPSYTVVGLPGTAVREGADRIRAALRNGGFPFPARRVTVNLAPAGIRKEGALLDLPIALSLLCALGMVPAEALGRHLVCGELSLDGAVRPVRGVLSQAQLARALGVPGLIVPAGNAEEAALVPGVAAVPVGSLAEAVSLLTGGPRLSGAPPPGRLPAGGPGAEFPDLADVAGQATARRALEIAAAGNHPLLLVGPPGCGKTMLAERLPGLLPDFDGEERLEAGRIYSAAGEPPWPRLLDHRPFRAPHHTVSPAGLVGGGNPPRPGEASLAHGGILFLDEFPEFRRDAREALRQPLESGEVRVVRAGRSHRFPCRFLLVAASNPCPCGHRGHPRRICRCSPADLSRFARAFSGPLLDRIDLAVSVPPLGGEAWAAARGEPSSAVRRRVAAARERQAERYPAHPGATNGSVRASLSGLAGFLAPGAAAFLARAADRLGLSGRGLARVARTALTIADLAGERPAAAAHVAEALQFRLPDFAALQAGGTGSCHRPGAQPEGPPMRRLTPSGE